MFNFSEEELIELSHYPKPAVEHANKQMTNMLHQGKTISSPFKLFVAICNRWVEEAQKKSPKTGKTQSNQQRPRPSNFTLYVEGGKWIPGAAIISSNKYNAVTHVETDLEFALNYEKAIHERTTTQPELARKTAAFDRNPIWAKLDDMQRNHIWIAAHPQPCSCRKNERAGLLLPEIAQQLTNKQQPLELTPLEEIYLSDSQWQEVIA